MSIVRVMITIRWNKKIWLLLTKLFLLIPLTLCESTRWRCRVGAMKALETRPSPRVAGTTTCSYTFNKHISHVTKSDQRSYSQSRLTEPPSGQGNRHIRRRRVCVGRFFTSLTNGVARDLQPDAGHNVTLRRRRLYRLGRAMETDPGERETLLVPAEFESYLQVFISLN